MSLLLAVAAGIGAGAPGGCFRLEGRSWRIRPQLQNLRAIFSPVRNNLRLSGAEPHVVVDAGHAGAARHGAGACWSRALFAGCMGRG